MSVREEVNSRVENTGGCKIVDSKASLAFGGGKKRMWGGEKKCAAKDLVERSSGLNAASNILDMGRRGGKEKGKERSAKDGEKKAPLQKKNAN